MDSITKIALETIEMNKQALVFAPSRASAEKSAEDISKLTSFSHPDLSQFILKSVSSPTKQCQRLAKIIRKGVAFHHSGLTSKQKEFIEDGFREGKIKIICCTPSLAAGVSLPAFRVIMKSLKRYSGKWGMDWIPVLEYMQMTGRAGRPEYESFGEAISIAKSEADKEEIYEKYVCGEPEDIYSKLAVEPVLRTYLLSLISSGIIRDEKSMKDFFSKTFWAFQFKDMQKLESIMDKMLSLLEEWEFVTIYKNSNTNSNSNFTAASELGNKDRKMRATLLGKRISELYLDPLTAKHLLDCIKNYNEDKNSFSLLQMISHTLEMRPQLRVKVSEQDKIQEELVNRYDQLLMKEPSAFDLEYNEFINSIKTSLFFEAWTNERNENFLFENFNVRPGEIRVKIEVANWLLYACSELCSILEYKNTARDIRRLRIRVKSGVKEELLPLLKLKGIGRVRARKLFTHGVKDLGEIKKAGLTTLQQLLGKALSESITKQIGEEIKEIPKGTRKGQLSLNKY